MMIPKPSLCTSIHSLTELEDCIKENTFLGLLHFHDPSMIPNINDLVDKWSSSGKGFDQTIHVYGRVDVNTALVRRLLPIRHSTTREEEETVQCILNDMTRLISIMQNALVLPKDRLTCRLNLMDQTRCPKWHEDHVDMRLVKTYYGPSTQWVDPSDVNIRNANNLRAMAGLDLIAPEEAIHCCTNDVVVMAGKKRSEYVENAVPVLHRSPILPMGVKRLLFTITVDH
eukprot:gene4201-4615_t